MAWIEDLLRRLSDSVPCGYDLRQGPASEPSALAALALLAHDRRIEAQPALEFLVACQGEDGGVGIRRKEPQPAWPTALAVLAWRASGDARFESPLRRATEWLTTARSEVMPRTPELGHDPTIAAWPWALGTHGWVEPTAMAVLALKGAGCGDSARTRDGVRMLLDRQLPGGGCNYGNTFVLGQKLRSHVQPTGLALAALAGESDRSGRIARSVAWLARSVSPQTASASLSWAILGLAAHGAAPRDAADWLGAAYLRVTQGDRSPYKFALLALAAARETPLLPSPRKPALSTIRFPSSRPAIDSCAIV